VNISSADGRLDVTATAQVAARVGYSGTETIFGNDAVDLQGSRLAYGTSKGALNRFTVGLAEEMRGYGIAVNALEVSAVTQAVRRAMPDVDHSQNELPEVPGQIVAWIASHPTEFTGMILSQFDLIAQLQAEGVLRPRVAP